MNIFVMQSLRRVFTDEIGDFEADAFNRLFDDGFSLG